jgi:hypothetical protein
MDDWTVEEVDARFAEAAETARRLPPVRVRGYTNVWEVLLRSAPERRAAEAGHYHLPPTPAAIDRMLEVMRWVHWLDPESRHLLWMRADRCEWSQIARRVGCAIRTAQRRRNIALSIVTEHLNGAGVLARTSVKLSKHVGLKLF